MAIISGSITTNSDSIQADGADDIIDALAGDDFVLGGAGDDILSGNLGNDLLDGGIGNDTLNGGDGDDRLVIDGIGADVVDGGTGIDLLSINQSSATTAINISYTSPAGGSIQNIEWVDIRTGSGDDSININAATGLPSWMMPFYSNSVYAGVGNDTIVGSSERDYLYGQDGNDTINGGAGNDYLYAGVGDDTLNGGDGADRLFIDYIGTDVVDGGVGEDRLYIDQSSATTTFNFSYTNPTGGSIQNIEEVDIRTGGGDDSINISAVPGSSSFYISNFVYVGAGNDIVIGSNVGDLIYGQDGNDILNGGDGDDLLDGGGGNDALNGGDGNDSLTIDYFGDVVDGGAGDDKLTIYQFGSAAVNITYATLTGSNIQNIEAVNIYTGNGDDNIDISAFAGAGASYWGTNDVFTGFGNDTVVGSSSSDGIYAGFGNDTLLGNAGNDYLDGSDGDDTLIGVNFNTSTPGLGEIDRLVGGFGADRFILATSDAIAYDDGDTTTSGTTDYAQINDFNLAEGDVVQLQGKPSNYRLQVVGSDTELYLDKPGTEPDELIARFINLVDEKFKLTSSAFSYVAPTIPVTGQNTFNVNKGEQLTIDNFGGVGKGLAPSAATIAEADTLKFFGTGLTPNNLILTQVGADLVLTFNGDSTTRVTLINFNLENLDNLAQNKGATVDLNNIFFDGQTTLTDNFDVFNANWQLERILNPNTVTFLNGLDNKIQGLQNSDDVINGLDGNDRIFGNSGNDLLRGGNGDDSLFGDAGNDALFGNTGNDILVGGAGADTLIGGGGTNTFHYAVLSDSLLANCDRITDLVIGTDVIDGLNTVTASNLFKGGTVSALTQAGISAVLNTSNFVSKGAAVFTYGTGSSTQTFLALNNNQAGFQANSDAIIEITGYSGSLNSLAIV